MAPSDTRAGDCSFGRGSHRGYHCEQSDTGTPTTNARLREEPKGCSPTQRRSLRQKGAKRTISTGRRARVEVVLACDAHQSKDGVAARVGERSPPRSRGLADATDWPFGGQPLALRMGEDRGESNEPASLPIPVVWTVAI
jgi:hypothetical protein